MESIIKEIENLANDIEVSPEPAQSYEDKAATPAKSLNTAGARVTETMASTAKQSVASNKQQLQSEQQSSKINQDLFYQATSENNSQD